MEDLVLSKAVDRPGYYYNRSNSNDQEQLRKSLAKYYERNAHITPSGMSAIYQTLSALVRKHLDEPVHIIYSSELYTDTPKVITGLSELHKSLTLTTIDVAKRDEIRQLFSSLANTPTILFIESCSNPNGYIFDFSLLPLLRKSCSTSYVVVDNTWLTHVIFQPFVYSVDFVVLSLTKYYSGGTAIAGCVLSNSSILNDVIDSSRRQGLHVSPHNCRLINDALSNMTERLQKSSSLTGRVYQALRTMNVANLRHPLDTEHLSYGLARQYFQTDSKGIPIGPSVFTFTVKAKRADLLKVLETLKTMEVKTSFGASKSRIDPFIKQKKDLIQCRISIGYDDSYENVMKGIQDFLTSISS